jgi:alkanesulfonate monooxygenase SsuD/methylene tetrahydromethanopterin reductase-like flavin-dependent oxidoreductase (luciferase family)
MRIGVSPFGASRDEALRLATAAVDAGLAVLWLGDGLLENADFPMWSGGLEAFTELAWLAGALPSASLGCSAAVLPLRDPLWLAKQAATLDHLTEGRFTLVVAPGFWAREFAFRGLDFTRRGPLFDAALDVLLGALAGDPGVAHSVAGPEPGRVSPPSFRPTGAPVWLAGARATMRRALARGLPFQASRMSPAALRPFAEEWRDAGGGKLAVRIRMQVGADVPAGDAVDWQAVAGPVAFLAEQLHRYASLGVSDVSVVPGQDKATSLATIDALTEIGPIALG